MKNALRLAFALFLSPGLVACGGSHKKVENPPTSAPASSAASSAAVTPPAEPPASSAASSAAAVTPPPASQPSGPALAGPTKKWDDMTKDEKKKWMKEVIYPEMKEKFQAFDAKKYADFKCDTCHGDGAHDGTFKMPNAKLPKLPDDQAGWAKLKETKGDYLKFMSQTVKPEMAKMIGEPEFDPKTQPDGFGCMECHTSAKK